MTLIRSDSRLEAACVSPANSQAVTTAHAQRSGIPMTRKLVAVRGTTLTDPEALADAGQSPAHEQVILLPRAILEGYRGSGL